jgi:hypothetical protein
MKTTVRPSFLQGIHSRFLSAMTLVLLLLSASRTVSFAQVFDLQMGGGPFAVTNILSPLAGSGTLLIDYDFFTIPDTLDVFYAGSDIFSSGLVNGAGEFVIPYGPGSDTSLMIVMNLAGNSQSSSVWQYQPTIVPVPEPGCFGLLTLGTLFALRRRVSLQSLSV